MPAKRKNVATSDLTTGNEKAKKSTKSDSNGNSHLPLVVQAESSPIKETSTHPNEANQLKLETIDCEAKSLAQFPQMSCEWLKKAGVALKSDKVAQKVAESAKFVGAHVGISGGIDKAPFAAADFGCKSFALFLRNQRTWKLKSDDLEKEAVFVKFRKNCENLSISLKNILPHGSYLLNAGSPDSSTLEKTRQTLLHEVKMCEKLGLPMYNFHPGSSCGKIPTEKCIQLIAESVNFVIDQTSDVIIVLETMASQGYTVGGTFQELKSVIDLIGDKTRVGVCLDTCHIFAAGYDIRTEKGYEGTMLDFDRIIGLKYLKALHLNDSKGKLGSKLDRHANIGKGELGMDCFRFIMQDKRLDGMPIILETPENSYGDEIALLYSIV